MSAGDVWPILNANAQYHSPGSPVTVVTGETIEGVSMIVTTRTWNIDISAYTHFDFSFTTPSDANVVIDTIAFQVVPEPATWASMLVGVALFAGCRRRFRVLDGK